VLTLVKAEEQNDKLVSVYIPPMCAAFNAMTRFSAMDVSQRLWSRIYMGSRILEDENGLCRLAFEIHPVAALL
jgi:hypothetical protein